MKEEGLGRNELVEVFDGFKVLFDLLETVMLPLLQMRTNGSYKKKKKKSVAHPFKKSYAYGESKTERHTRHKSTLTTKKFGGII